MTAAPEQPSQATGPSSVVLVASIEPHAGKSSLASAIAVSLAYEGRRMLLLRLAGSEAGAEAASADAAFFQTLPFARGRGGQPVSVTDALAVAAEQRQAGALLLLEAPEGADAPALAAELDASVVLAVRTTDGSPPAALSDTARALGDRLLGVVALAVPAGLVGSARSTMSADSWPLLGVIPEDATLYAPSVLELAEALDAEVVLGEPTDADIIEHLMIGSITTDPGQPYYARPRNRRAVITRSDKTDLQLAAMHTDIDCLILTGGVAPSPYTIDRAADNEITVLLTKADTCGAVKLVEDIFFSTRFASEEKLERMRALLAEHFDWETLKRRLGGALPAS
jgi:hypothetical protein